MLCFKVEYRGEIMSNPLEKQLRDELYSEIESSEKNYYIIKDILSGTIFEHSRVMETLQSFKDNLSKVNSMFGVLSQIQAKGNPILIPINPLLEKLDFALVLLEWYPQQNPGSFIQTALALSNIKIENVMSLLSILKKLI